MNFFPRRTLRQRIGLGFTTVLAILLAVGGIAYGLLERFNSDFVSYRRNARESNLLAETEVEILLARVNVKDFLLSHEEAKRSQVETYIQQASRLVREAQEKIVDPERHRHLTEVKGALDRYTAAFANISQLDRKGQIIQFDRLDVSGPAMEKKLTDLMRSAKASGDTDAAYNAGETLRSLMLARLYVQRYTISHSTDHLERVRKELDTTDRSLHQLAAELANPDRRGLAKEAAVHFSTYKAAFEEKVQITEAFVQTVHDKLDPNGRGMAQAVDALRTVIRADQDALGPKVVEDMAWGSRTMLAIATTGLLLGSVFAYGLGHSISRPIVSITGVMVRLASGDLSVMVPSITARDEVGDMARAVEVFKQNGLERERLLTETQGDQLARAARQAHLEALNTDFRAEVQALLGAVADTTLQMQASSGLLLSISEDTARRADGATATSHTASANGATVAAATQEMTSSIHEIGQQVEQASVIIRDATETARGTSVQVTDLVEAARKIGEVVTLIQSIAAQTNLLALNATIEAARAGDAGRGFAVVAAEVKGLAGQTASATEEIAQQIAAVQNSTHAAAEAMRTVAHTIDRIDGIAQSIAIAVTHQSGVTAQISVSVGEVATGSERVSQDIHVVTTAMADATRVAAETSRAATSVSDRTAKLRDVVDRFLASTQAA